MTYQPYLIANYSTGLDKRLQPWLSPDDAQLELFDGYVYRGTMSKREGYNYFAIGEKNGQPYTESRIVKRVTNQLSVFGTGVQGPYTFKLYTVFTQPLTVGDGTVGPYAATLGTNLVPNTVIIVDSTTPQVLSDDGSGNLVGNGSGTINYVTGVANFTFTLAVGLGNPITQTYANRPVRRGTVTLNDPISAQTVTDDGLGVLSGDGVGTINYQTGIGVVTFNAVIGLGNPVNATFDFFPDNPVMMVASFYTATNIRELIVADTRFVNRYNPNTNILEDISPASPYTGNNHNFFSWVNYPDASDNPRLLFVNNKDVIQSYDGSTVTDYAYTSATITTLTALIMVNFKDRLILLRTTENGTIFPRRIRISGTGTNCDNFNTSAIGAGVIDIPDNTWIYGAAFNRDDLIIFTEGSTWVLKYTGNDTTPFVLDKIDESRGSQAPFAAITYLNRTSAASPRGLIITDGYRVERQDISIPDFSFNEVDGANFDLCFAGSVDADRDHYLIYPTPNKDQSNRILTTNYDEDNYSIYRLPLSCMGNYITSFDVTWNDLLEFPNWSSFAASYGNWNSFAYTAGAPFSIGGGHHGEIWRLAVTEMEDNPVKIRNITIIDETTVEVTTDWNNYSDNTDDESLPSDTIFITGVSGMLEINDQQYPIVVGSVVDHYTFQLTVPSTANFSAFTTDSIGEAVRVIPFSSLLKQFNPFLEQDKKVRCGWLYVYVDSTGTDLRRNIEISDATQSNPCVITTFVNHNLSTGNEVNFFGVGGMTELNNNSYFITVLSPTTFSLNGIDSSGFTAFTSGGYVSVAENAKMSIDILTNDRQIADFTQLNNLNSDPYQGTCTNLSFEDGAKKWYKVYINQTGRFIQFRLRNTQAGAKINIQATMPGFQPVGRIL